MKKIRYSKEYVISDHCSLHEKLFLRDKLALAALVKPIIAAFTSASVLCFHPLSWVK